NHSLVAGESSRARLGFPDGSYVELEPSTALRITALDETEAGYDLRVNLTAGRITSYVRPRLAGAYEVITPSATISATGTVFSVEVVGDQAAIVSCAEGEVVVWTGREQLVLAAGETIAAIAGQPLVAGGPQPEPGPTQASLEPGEYPTPSPPELVAPPLAEVLVNRPALGLSRTVVVAAPVAVLPAEAAAPPPPAASSEG